MMMISRFFAGLACLAAALIVLPSIVKAKTDVQIMAEQLTPAAGYKVGVFYDKIANARVMALTSRGDVLVSQPGYGQIQLIGVSKNTPSSSLSARVLVKGLDRPFGLVIDGNWLYIAEQRQVVRYPFDADLRKITGPVEVLFKGMPAGGHSTRTIAKGPDGWFYVSVGSSCNVCIERHKWRAAMLRFKPGQPVEIYATGLRNTVGYDWHPKTQELFGSDHGRDWLGDDLPPGEINQIVQGGFYGWPYFYGANVRDTKFGGNYDEKKHGKAIGTAHDMQAHVAPLSLRFLKQHKDSANGLALVTQHGSWNHSGKVGYKVIQLAWDDQGKITQSDFLTGFLKNGRTKGRPVDTLELPDGTVLVSDDHRGVIWKMTPQ